MFTKKLLLRLLALTMSLVSAVCMAESSHFSPAQTKAIGVIVHDYLLKNPTLLVEVSQKLQAEQQAKELKNVKKIIPSIAADLFLDDSSPVLGNPKGTVTISEFFDYRCPHCQAMSSVLENLLQQHANLRVVLKELPIFGGPSKFAAEAALASQNEPNFAAFHKALLENKAQLTNAIVLKLAQEQGLDTKKLQVNMKSKAVADQLKANFTLSSKIGLQGTPLFIVAKTPTTGAKATAKSLQFSYIPGQASLDDLQTAITKAEK